MNGALPPSSNDTFFTVEADCSISFLPTSVEPVNVTLRTISLVVISVPFLAKAFNVSSVTVWKALRFEQDTDTIRRIQKAARERGGIVMAVAPVMETLHDHDNVIRQYFPNGALLEISKNDSTGVVTYKGEEVRHYDNVTFSNIDSIQNFAAALK